MFKRSAAHYSLWPEQRQRRSRPLKFAAGSFVLGMVCATAYGALFNFTAPATGQAVGAPRAVAPVPIVIAHEPRAGDAVPLPAPKPDEITSRPSRARASAAKVTLPLIGAPPPKVVTADARGDDGFAGEVRLTGAEPAGDDAAGLLGGDNEPPRSSPARGAAARKPAEGVVTANPAAPASAAKAIAVVPMPRPAPARATVVGKDNAAPTHVAVEAVSREPQVTQAAPPTMTKPAATTTSPAKQRDVADLGKNRERPAVVARGDDEPAEKPVARASKRKTVETASVRKRRIASKIVAPNKMERPTRSAAKSRPKREVATRHAARQNHDDLGPMIARATQAFRAFTGSQGFGVPAL